MGRTREIARRAICASNQRQFAAAMITYTNENDGHFVSCRGRQIQKAFNPMFSRWGGSNGKHIGSSDYTDADNEVDWVGGLASVGLVHHNPSGNGLKEIYRATDIMNCPSRDYESQWETQFPQLISAYNYYGGIKTWRNPWATVPSRSPVHMGSAQPDWAIVTDTTMKIDFFWGGVNATRDTAYYDTPAHSGDLNLPEGSNIARVDGAVYWIPFERMIYIHTWGIGGDRVIYSHQEDLGDFSAPAQAYGWYEMGLPAP
jgi:hypothetical protein